MKEKTIKLTRNEMMVLNSIIVVITTILNILFGMEEVKLFLDKYGTDINGLMQSGKQILGYLTLIEAGLCAAYMFKLYEAVSRKDNGMLSSLYFGFKKNMISVVRKMLIVALLICLIYPLFMQNKGFSYPFMVSVLVLLSLNTILPYRLILVPKYMIVLKEQKYKVEIIAGITKSITFIVEIIILVFFSLPIQIILLACTTVSIASGIVYQNVMNKIYKSEISDEFEEDTSPSGYSKDLIVHNISNLVFNSTDNVILSILGSFNDVTLYSNYNMISGYVLDFSHKIVDGATATLGIKIAGKEKSAYGVFREILVGSLFAAGIITSTYITMINRFIGDIWVGRQYCLDDKAILLFALIMYCGIILPCIQQVRSISGLFKESKYFILTQAIVNLALTILLVPFYGITGALIGTAFSRLFITLPFSYFLIYKKVFPDEKNKYYEIIISIFLVICTWRINMFVLGKLKNLLLLTTIWNFIIETCISFSISFLIFGIFYYITDKHFSLLFHRILNIVRREKGNKNG